ncbi:NAD dependent epimerase/dehydratase [Crepidotus variabilis]|uniref:NAD dependent epimerase/dehydratase n=1 Tax=Crepidotus variabilis TaxID=179855 RepID=A0A9P6JKT0_9AGAR|nr:NAD dependent epimerase/dehydratase [Crepidotus variabilis]
MSTGTILIVHPKGTAVTTHLIEKGHRVHALVRDLAEETALEVKSIGATLFEGAVDDADAISRAVAGCTGLYFNLMPTFNDENQVEQAKVILQAAKTAGVKHVIYNSSLAVGKQEERKQWDSKNPASAVLHDKQATEELVRQAGFETWTILRPGYFMTYFLAPLGKYMYPELGSKGELVSSFQPNTVLPVIDPNDIAAFNAAAFSDPKKFGGQEIALAGELISVEGLVQALSKATGKNIKAVYRSADETEAVLKTNLAAAGQLLALDMNKYVDMEEVKKWGIKLGTTAEFLEREQSRVQNTFGSGN